MILNRLLPWLRTVRGAAGATSQHHKSVCTSICRTLHRLGMSGRVDIRPFADGKSPALFITIERSALKHSQAAMAILAREMVDYARRKYQTEIDGVYWRIEADFDHQDDLMGDVFGPTTVGYLVEETIALYQQADSQVTRLGQAIHQVNANIAAGLGVSGQSVAPANQVRDVIDRHRFERGTAETGAFRASL